jgi:hypothetical protein
MGQKRERRSGRGVAEAREVNGGLRALFLPNMADADGSSWPAVSVHLPAGGERGIASAGRGPVEIHREFITAAAR